MERAGFWRRGFAAAVDLVLVQILLQGLVALAFALTGGHVTTTYTIFSRCETSDVKSGAVHLPSGAVLPPGFVPNQQGICRSSFFGATTRLVVVANRVDRQGPTVTTLTQAYPLGPDGRTLVRVLDVDFLFLPLFVLLRWAGDRHLGGSLGRRLARIVVTDADGAAVGADLARGLARRTARFAWPLLPSVAGELFASIDAAATGSVPMLLWIFGRTFTVAAWIAAARQIMSHTDTFYDAPVGTCVAPRTFVDRSEAPPAPIPPIGLVAEAAAALKTGWCRRPRLAIALLAAMALVYGLEVLQPGGPSPRTLVVFGGMDRELVVMLGQVYRLAAAIMIHGSLTHIAANGFALLAAGWLVENLFGRVLFGGVFLLGGLAGSVASIAFNGVEQVGMGASGAIQALFAAALVVSPRLPQGARRAWMVGLPIALGVPALMPVMPVPGTIAVDRADHVGGTIAGLAMGLAIAIAARGGVIRRPRRRTAVAVGGLVAAILLLPIPVTGWRDPAFAAHLVPADEMPQTDTGWRDRAVDLAARYPDDPRVVLGLAMHAAATGDKAGALRDLDRAIALQRGLAPAVAADFRFTAHADLGGEFFAAGDLDAAITQYGAALSEKPMVVMYRQRGIAEFYRGRSDDALADLRQAVTIAPKEAYSVLWLSIVAVRSGAHDPIAATAPQVGDEGWPDKIVAFYDGKTDAATMAAWAATLDLEGDQHRVCEATFYEGEQLIMQGRSGPARPLIEQAAKTCPHDFIEYRGAEEELAGALGAPAN